MSIQRERVYAALFQRLRGVANVVTCTRILRHWSDVPAEQQPAIFMTQGNQVPSTDTRQRTRWLLSASVYVYVRTGGGAVPGTELNRILDAIDVALERSEVSGVCNLGLPEVEWARIEGAIDTDEGTLGEQAVAIVPIQILVT